MANSQSDNVGRFRMNTEGWPPERWAAIIVLSSLAALILIRRGFRGINVLGANVSVS